MQIEKSERFNDELQIILDFISTNNPERALNFYDNLISEILAIPQNPYRCRKAKPSDDKNIRELIYKKYTIPYYIDLDRETIVVLGIFNQNEWRL